MVHGGTYLANFLLTWCLRGASTDRAFLAANIVDIRRQLRAQGVADHYQSLAERIGEATGIDENNLEEYRALGKAVDAEMVVGVELEAFSTYDGQTLYRGKGCAVCGMTGYVGRLGIFEILEITDALKKLIDSSHFNIDMLREEARKNGMITMFEDGLRKIELAETTIDEVLRVIRE